MSIIPEVKAVKQLKQYYQLMKEAQDSMKGGGKRKKGIKTMRLLQKMHASCCSWAIAINLLLNQSDIAHEQIEGQ